MSVNERYQSHLDRAFVSDCIDGKCTSASESMDLQYHCQLVSNTHPHRQDRTANRLITVTLTAFPSLPRFIDKHGIETATEELADRSSSISSTCALAHAVIASGTHLLNADIDKDQRSTPNAKSYFDLAIDIERRLPDHVFSISHFQVRQIATLVMVQPVSNPVKCQGYCCVGQMNGHPFSFVIANIERLISPSRLTSVKLRHCCPAPRTMLKRCA